MTCGPRAGCGNSPFQTSDPKPENVLTLLAPTSLYKFSLQVSIDFIDYYLGELV